MQVIIKNQFKNQFKNQQMRKITLFIALITFFNINSQTVMTFNSSQEITDPISILCQSYDDENDISWDYYCEGVWEDNFWDGDTHQCPETSFVAQSTGNYVIRITDIFGNGWNGTTLGVNVNGQSVLSNLGIGFIGWEEEYTFYANEGDLVTAFWSNVGPWYNECGYRIASQEAISSVEFPSNTYSQIYYRQFVPYDFGYSGSLQLTDIQFGVWYTDVNGNPNSTLPSLDIQANIYINNNGGVGGQFGITLENLSGVVASTNNITITPNDHQTIVSAPIEFDGAGNFLENGYEANSSTEYVVELIFPNGTPSPMQPGFRLSTGGNLSDFTLETSNQSQNPSTRNNSSNCTGFFTYTPDNSSLINLVSSTEPDIPSYDVTFNVDMSNQFVEPEGVFLGGGMFGGAQTHQMFDDDGDNIYSVTLSFQEGVSGNYIFINGPSWGGDFSGAEQLSGQECADLENFDNRFFGPITGDTSLDFCFGECDSECSLLPPPAPLPTASPEDVISVYSDYYNVGVSNFIINPFWQQQTILSELNVGEGDNVMLLQNLNYQGHEFGSVDISSMTHVHFDYFNGEDSFGNLRLSLINTNAPGGTVEQFVSTNASTVGQWVQVDIPLSEYTNMTNLLSGINQLKWDTISGGGSIYIDNVYFYTDNTAGIEDFVDDSLRFYPNPVINKINIQSQSIIDKVVVKNILGQDLFELSPNLKDFEIDFSEVSSGNYLLQISTRDGLQTLRVIVK